MLRMSHFKYDLLVYQNENTLNLLILSWSGDQKCSTTVEWPSTAKPKTGKITTKVAVTRNEGYTMRH